MPRPRRRTRRPAPLARLGRTIGGTGLVRERPRRLRRAAPAADAPRPGIGPDSELMLPTVIESAVTPGASDCAAHGRGPVGPAAAPPPPVPVSPPVPPVTDAPPVELPVPPPGLVVAVA